MTQTICRQNSGKYLLSSFHQVLNACSLYASFLIPSSDQISGGSWTENKKISSSRWRTATNLFFLLRRKKNFHSFFQVENFPGHWLPPVRKWTESSQLSSVFRLVPTSARPKTLCENFPIQYSSFLESWRMYPSLEKKKKKFLISRRVTKTRDRNRRISRFFWNWFPIDRFLRIKISFLFFFP